MDTTKLKRLRAFLLSDVGRLTRILVGNGTIFLLLYFFWNPKIDSFPPELTSIEAQSETRPSDALDALARYDTARCMPGAVSYYHYISLKAHCLLHPDYQMSPARLTKTIIDFEYVEPKPQRLADLYYYSACVFRNLNDYPQAQGYFLKSIPLYEKLEDKRKLGRCCYEVGGILRNQYFYEEASRRFAASEVYCREANDTLYQCLALCELAGCYRAVGKSTMADTIYRKALRIAREGNLRKVEARLCGQYAALLTDRRRYSEAERLMDCAPWRSDLREKSSCLLTLARIYRATGREEKAVRCCQELLRMGTIDAKQEAARILSSYYQSKGKLAEAVKYANQSVAASDSLKTHEAMVAVSRMNAAYNYSDHLRQEQQLRKEKLRRETAIEAISMLFVVVVFCFLWKLRRMNKKKREQMRKYADVVVSLRETEEARQILQRQLEEREEQLRDMASQKGLQDEKLARIKCAEVYQKFKSVGTEELAFSALSASDWQSLEQLVYDEFPRFHDVLFSIPNLSEQNRNMCLLIKADFKPVEISRLLCRDKSTINSARRRLYERVFGEKGTPSLWDEFIRSV